MLTMAITVIAVATPLLLTREPVGGTTLCGEVRPGEDLYYACFPERRPT